MKEIRIVGAGLSGSEAALQFADKGWNVELYEMRPKVMTPAHKTDKFSEVVCSNSFKSVLLSSASGLFKSELNLIGCKLLEIAEKFKVPAGSALAIDREKFSEYVTEKIKNHPNIKIINDEFYNFDNKLTIIATGPLTSDKLIEKIQNIIGEKQLYFFDAIAPIISAESINYDIVYRKARYDKGEADYLNCPFTKEQYAEFVKKLNLAQKHEAKEFENQFFSGINFNFYENCTPIEELARRGTETLRFGVMKPVGLNMEDGKRPYAVVQLRSENKDNTSYNLVGCQTMLTYPEQKRILRTIHGLEKAEFLRFGSIHRNTYLNFPEIANRNFSLKNAPNIFVIGQLTGVEGYVESIFTGVLIAKIIMDDLQSLPKESISGQLWNHITKKVENFQPMNANFCLLPPLEEKIREKRKRKLMYSERSINILKAILKK